MNEEEKKESPPTTDDSPQQSEQLNNLSAEEPIVQAVETTSEVDQPQTTNYKPETEDMEVHHHTHHEHGKRNWKSYFWEFLMLFLAVFCGFLAEYQLEHKIESDREKQFLKSMVKDLNTDVQLLDSLIRQKNYRMSIGDSLRRSLIDKSYLTNGANVYFWARNISRRAFFFSTDGTVQQLKNAGGLRLISNQFIKEKIIDYDMRYRNLQSFQNLEEELLMNYRNNAARLFDAGVFINIIQPYDTLKVDLPKGNPQLISNNFSDINELSNKVTFWTQSARVQIRLLSEQKEKAIALVLLIEKEYHLK